MASYILGLSESARHKPELISYLCKRLEAAGFNVQHPTAAPEALMLEQLNQQLLEVEATHLKLKKQVELCGNMEEFDINNRDVFKDVDQTSFFLDFEKAFLTGKLLQTVKAGHELGKLLPNTHCSSEDDLRKVENDELLHTCIREGVVEYATPVHSSSGVRRLWQTIRFQLMVDPHAMRSYFGEQVAFYFAWMNSFTLWLIPPAVVGFVVFLFGAVEGLTVDTNYILPFFSMGMSLWAVLGVKLWRRTSNGLAWDWGTAERAAVDVIRPQFVGRPRKSPVTGRDELHFPSLHRLPRYLLSAVVTCTMLAGVAALIIVSLNFQGYIDNPREFLYIPLVAQFSQPGAIFDPNQSNFFIPLVPVVVHVSVLLSINIFAYRQLAEMLTSWENHKTEQAHLNSLMVKRFLYEAFDCYVPLSYLAFYEQNAGKVRRELIALYTADCARRLFLETIVPLVGLRVGARLHRAQGQQLKRELGEKADGQELTWTLLQQEYDEFDDYLEMVVEFGYITMFAAAFPLAGLISLVYNIIEMKSDALKLCFGYRRPPVVRVNSIGSWDTVLTIQAWLSAITNVLLVGFSSEQLMGWFPFMYTLIEDGDGGVRQVLKEGYCGAGMGLVVVMEHVLLLTFLLITFGISDIPHRLAIALRKRAYEAEQQWVESRRSMLLTLGSSLSRKRTASVDLTPQPSTAGKADPPTEEHKDPWKDNSSW